MDRKGETTKLDRRLQDLGGKKRLKTSDTRKKAVDSPPPRAHRPQKRYPYPRPHPSRWRRPASYGSSPTRRTAPQVYSRSSATGSTSQPHHSAHRHQAAERAQRTGDTRSSSPGCTARARPRRFAKMITSLRQHYCRRAVSAVWRATTRCGRCARTARGRKANGREKPSR